MKDLSSVLLNKDDLINGVRSVDMPCAGPACEGTYLDGAAFAINFKSPNNHRELIYNVHYGCLQHFHAQGSVVTGPLLDLPDGANRYVFTNTELKSFMMAQAQDWWSRAVSQTTVKLRSYYVARLLHTLADSYPRGHTLRDNTNSYPYMTTADPLDPEGKGRTMATKCGKLWYFQGYDAQKGNDAHAAADKQPGVASEDYGRLQCAKYYSWKILRVLCNNGGKGAWADAQKVLDEAWQLAPWAAGHKTAGAVAQYAATGLAAKGYASVSYPLPGAAVSVWEPTSAKLWGSIPASAPHISLCPPTLIGKAPTIPYGDNPFTTFVNPSKGRPMPGGVTLVDCYKQGTSIFYQHPTGDCKCTNMILTCSKGTECAPMPGKGCNGGVCKCQNKLPGNTCRCLVPHPGTYPYLCTTESYGDLKP